MRLFLIDSVFLQKKAFKGKGVVALDMTFDRGKIMITMTPNVVTLQNELVIVILCFFLTVIVSIFAPR